MSEQDVEKPPAQTLAYSAKRSRNERPETPVKAYRCGRVSPSSCARAGLIEVSARWSVYGFSTDPHVETDEG